MPAYLVFSYDVVDREKYAAYAQNVGPVLLSRGAEVLVVDTGGRYLEGHGRGLNVVIRFKSEEAALDFYNSAEYEPLKSLRVASTANATCLLAQEFVLPS